MLAHSSVDHKDNFGIDGHIEESAAHSVTHSPTSTTYRWFLSILFVCFDGLLLKC